MKNYLLSVFCIFAANIAAAVSIVSEPILASYTLTSIQSSPSGIIGNLKFTGEPSDKYGPDIETLKLEVYLGNENYVRVKISDPSSQRWEVPNTIVDRTVSDESEAKASTSSLYYFSYSKSPFTFTVTRQSDGATLFKSSEELVFKDQYITLGTSVSPTAKTFGLGESTRLEHSLVPGNTYTLWAADIGAQSFYSNLYGSFPYYLQLLDGQAHGALFMNSNGMDVFYSPAGDQIKFTTIGGVIDLYVFVGPSPKDVLSQYTSVVGRPALVPYWSLGFHNCRWGYQSLDEVEEVVNKYEAAGIPLEAQWMDIDYMDAYKDFTTDPVKFPTTEVKAFVDSLHSKGQRVVPIIDPGILVKSGYDAYEKGLSLDLFVKDLKGGNYMGQVWPGATYFPDFFHPNTQSYWTDQLRSFYNAVPVDGLWIDMNEVSNFCNDDGTSQVCSYSGSSHLSCILDCTMVDPENNLDFPPYAIGNDKGLLSTKTMAMSAQHYGNISVYNAHNLYGISEQIATRNALKDIRGKRPFVLSRSSFVGTGVYSAKWTGDNAATWDDLKSSIISIMDFNIFGIPMIGADICGFNGATTEELCARWIEVGAFYPFSRNHNAIGQPSQELYLWESVTESSKKALSIRYQLLPYIYTLFYRAHTVGSAVAAPIFFTFPEDPIVSTIDEQFMLGDFILISPALYEGQNIVDAYFPTHFWYSFADLSLSVDASAGGKYVSLQTDLTDINVHIKGGSILPLQDAAMTTTEARKSPFTLLVALCPVGEADGELFWDDGEQTDLVHFVTAEYTANVTTGSGEVAAMTAVSDDVAQMNFESVRITNIVVIGRDLQPPLQSVVTIDGRKIPVENVIYSSEKITFTNVNLSITQAFTLNWVY